jgi:DNA-directed RNA polymerase subunit RPC12/RpoP
MISWYYCNSCMKEFSYVETGSNDVNACTTCHSPDIKRVVRGRRKKGIFY